jgi:hypothetical protein
MNGSKKHILFFLAASLVSLSLLANRPDTLFLSDDVINIEIRSDFSAIQKNRMEEPVYFDGEIKYHDQNGKEIKLPVRVEARGNFRRNPANCHFPPLAINFKKSQTRGTLFENQDKLKLVTPCQFDNDVIEEYLVYKMYNSITDQSFRVRLVKVLYFDTGKNKRLFVHHSFFIEAETKAALRCNAVISKKPKTPFDLEREGYRRLSIFQFMIGNKDWFVSSGKNMVIMQPSDSTLPYFTIPYDFDFAGFVNAEYTKPKGIPDEMLSERRVFKGICYTPDEFEKEFSYFYKQKPVFEGIIKNMDLLPKYTRNTDVKYIDEFYDMLSDRKMIIQEFLNVCETRKLYNLTD